MKDITPFYYWRRQQIQNQTRKITKINTYLIHHWLILVENHHSWSFHVLEPYLQQLLRCYFCCFFDHPSFLIFELIKTESWYKNLNHLIVFSWWNIKQLKYLETWQWFLLAFMSQDFENFFLEVSRYFQHFRFGIFVDILTSLRSLSLYWVVNKTLILLKTWL